MGRGSGGGLRGGRRWSWHETPGAIILATLMRPGEILSYDEMCSIEQGGKLQRGMTFRSPPAHGIILMSLRANAPYADAMAADGVIQYEGHNVPVSREHPTPRTVDQPRVSARGRLTENGKFADWTDRFLRGEVVAARFHVYEKLQPGIWTFRGVFEVRDFRVQSDGTRLVFKFELHPSDVEAQTRDQAELQHDSLTRQIPTVVKLTVFKRDHGRCVLCGATKNLHYDHDLPYSKGGASATAENVRLLCAAHNLAKSARIE